jgi:hypothetical protein
LQSNIADTSDGDFDKLVTINLRARSTDCARLRSGFATAGASSIFRRASSAR